MGAGKRVGASRSSKRGRWWSPHEDAMLREFWDQEDRRDTAQRIGRSVTACVQRFAKLRREEAVGATPFHGQRWTDDHDNTLITQWGQEPAETTARRVGRTVAACRERLQALGREGLIAASSSLTRGRKTPRQIAEETGYSRRQVMRGIKGARIAPVRLSTVSKRYALTEDQVERVIAFLGQETREVTESEHVDELVDRLGVDRRSIYRLAEGLGLDIVDGYLPQADSTELQTEWSERPIWEQLGITEDSLVRHARAMGLRWPRPSVSTPPDVRLALALDLKAERIERPRDKSEGPVAVHAALRSRYLGEALVSVWPELRYRSLTGKPTFHRYAANNPRGGFALQHRPHLATSNDRIDLRNPSHAAWLVLLDDPATWRLSLHDLAEVVPLHRSAALAIIRTHAPDEHPLAVPAKIVHDVAMTLMDSPFAGTLSVPWLAQASPSGYAADALGRQNDDPATLTVEELRRLWLDTVRRYAKWSKLSPSRS